MTNTAVLFDFDGTLFFGTTDINYHTFNLALAEMGRPPITREVANTTVGDKIPDVCRRLLGTEDETLVQTFYDAIFRNVPQAIRDYAVIEPDCVHMLQTLSQHAKLAICSNAEKNYLMALLEKFDLVQYFSCIWYAHPGCNKVAAIPQVINLLGAERAVMVGDRWEDVSSGKANGCITVAMQNDFGARDAIGADYDVTNHREMEQTILHILEERE